MKVDKVYSTSGGSDDVDVCEVVVVEVVVTMRALDKTSNMTMSTTLDFSAPVVILLCNILKTCWQTCIGGNCKK